MAMGGASMKQYANMLKGVEMHRRTHAKPTKKLLSGPSLLPLSLEYLLLLPLFIGNESLLLNHY